MAPLKSQLSIPLATIILLLLNSWPVVAAAGDYTAIFSLGDSLTDTGNYLLSGHKPAQVANPPYGETYFHRPTGRFSNGRIVIDFIAQALGLPLVRPYLAGGSGKDFRYGANFAVGGATALDNDFFRRRGYNATWTEYSLGHQMKWFKKVLHLLSLSGSGSSHEILSKSLVLMGEIGGNDYIESLINKRSINETTSLVPLVAKKIVHVTKNLIKLGARRVVVPGITPLGCTAIFLTMFQQKNEGAQGYYDPSTGCINWLNDLAKYHNKVVKDSVARLQRRYPHATITYADYYENCMSIYKAPAKDGFKEGQVACCGGGGPFNVAFNLMCGDKGNKVCSDPSSYVCWDGVHFTESANKILASGFLYGPYLDPPIL